MRKYSIFTILLALILSTISFAQSSQSIKKLIKQNKIFTADKIGVRNNTFFGEYGQQLGLSPDSEMTLKARQEEKNGMAHYRYHQSYKGLPVFGTYYIIHESENGVKNATGYIAPNLQMDIVPKIDEQLAILRASGSYSPEIAGPNLPLPLLEPYDNVSASLCIIDANFPKLSGEHLLAYNVILERNNPEEKRQVFVSAVDGDIIFEQSLIHHEAVNGTGVTKYYGTQNIVVDSLNPNKFLLQDPTRNILSIDENGEVIEGNSKYWDLTNAEQDEVILDGHYCTQEFYDMMLERFDWKGIDDNGGPLKIFISPAFYINASWNGEQASFGRGDCNHGPLTTMEVVAHEFMHGITDYTSDLVYAGEPGAINESMSDVFGKALEYYADNANFTWYIGKSFLTTQYGRYFRSMIDPHERNHPKMYKGEYWVDGGGVHTNSSIGNHWFYLLVEGASGVNEAGTSYNIQALGMDKALQVVFLTQKSYLGQNSNYNDYYNFSLLAAEEIFGQGAWEVESVREAWKAVGLPTMSNTPRFDLSISLGSRYRQSCILDEYIDIDFIITNEGSVDFNPASTNAQIEFEGMFITALNQYIPAGSSYTYTHKNALLIEGYGDNFLQALIKVSDDNPANNSTFQILQNGNEVNNDLGLSAQERLELHCNNDSTFFTVLLRNYSCDAISAGGNFTINVYSNGGYMYSYSGTLSRSLPKLGYYVLRLGIPNKFSRGTALDFELVHNNDGNTDNNLAQIFTVSPDKITGPFLDPFSDYDLGIYLNERYFNYGITNYQGENYLALTGTSINIRNATCPDAMNTINTNLSGAFGVCAELTGMTKPYFSFDLIQFRNNANTVYPELIENGAILKVEWSDANDSGEDIIYGLTEGQLNSYRYPLPSEFSGQIRFSFFCWTGSSISAHNFLDFDVILMDNFRIADGYSSTFNHPDDYFSIFPNPSNGVFHIDHKLNAPQEMIVHDAQGRRIIKNNYGDLSAIDLFRVRKWRLQCFSTIHRWKNGLEKCRKTIASSLKVIASRAFLLSQLQNNCRLMEMEPCLNQSE